jgi:hypothetical protein
MEWVSGDGAPLAAWVPWAASAVCVVALLVLWVRR